MEEVSRSVAYLKGRVGPDVTGKRVMRWAFMEFLCDGVQALEELKAPGFASWHCCFSAV